MTEQDNGEQDIGLQKSFLDEYSIEQIINGVHLFRRVLDTRYNPGSTVEGHGSFLNVNAKGKEVCRKIIEEVEREYKINYRTLDKKAIETSAMFFSEALFERVNKEDFGHGWKKRGDQILKELRAIDPFAK